VQECLKKMRYIESSAKGLLAERLGIEVIDSSESGYSLASQKDVCCNTAN